MWQLVYTAPEVVNPFEGAEVIPFPAPPATPTEPLRKPVSMTIQLGQNDTLGVDDDDDCDA